MLNISIWRRRAKSGLVDAYALWVADQMTEGWDAYLATFLFDDVPV